MASPKTLPPEMDAPRSLVTKAEKFTLSDQFDAAYSCDFPRPRPTVLCFGDMLSAHQIEGWIRPLYQQFEEQIDIIGVAIFNRVPEIFRPLVRLTLASQSPKSVLIDWDGRVARAYEVPFGACSVCIVSQDGVITSRARGLASPSEIQRLQSAISTLM